MVAYVNGQRSNAPSGTPERLSQRLVRFFTTSGILKPLLGLLFVGRLRRAGFRRVLCRNGDYVGFVPYPDGSPVWAELAGMAASLFGTNLGGGAREAWAAPPSFAAGAAGW